MKTTIALLTIAASFALQSCMTSTSTAPDGTVTVIRSSDPLALAAATDALHILTESRKVTPEK